MVKRPGFENLGLALRAREFESRSHRHMEKNMVLISVACLFKESRRKDKWLIVQPKEDSDWELPRIIVRKAESSARASIRMCGEQLGVNIQVLEEAGRAGGVTTINDKTVPQRHLYYLAVRLDASGEAIAFHKIKWLDYAKAIRQLLQKRDRQMLKAAREELVRWRRRQEKEELELKRIQLEKLQRQK